MYTETLLHVQANRRNTRATVNAGSLWAELCDWGQGKSPILSFHWISFPLKLLPYSFLNSLLFPMHARSFYSPSKSLCIHEGFVYSPFSSQAAIGDPFLVPFFLNTHLSSAHLKILQISLSHNHLNGLEETPIWPHILVLQLVTLSQEFPVNRFGG